MNNKLIIVALLNCLGMLQFGLTAIAQPQATTLAATSIGQTSATLHGTVNPNGDLAAAYYQYGLTTNYDNLGGFVALPATNTAQTLSGLAANSLRSPAGASWTSNGAPSTLWESIASSADGTRLAAAAYAGGVYISTNFGGTWTKTSVPDSTSQGYATPGIASSADGLRLSAVVAGDIYTSANGGTTWTQAFTLGTLSWSCIASSADGSQLAAALFSGGIYTSTNFGATWTPTSAPSDTWETIASSADGLRLAAGTFNNGIYTSTNGGLTWTQTSASHSLWRFIASSADGTRLAAAESSYIHISANGGATWTLSSAPFGILWRTVAFSADGTRLAAGSRNNGIYTSTDGGNTWIQAGAPIGYWQAIASSADGTQLAAVVDGGGIYTSTGAAISLTPGTLYHYRAVGLNTAGTSLGNDLTFTTAAGAPTATTRAASPISATNATLNGMVTTGNLTTSAYYQYGLTTNYGSYTTTNTLAATNIAVSTANLISSLTPRTSYHFQLVVSNSSGMAKGGDFTFSTPASSPIVTTLAATSITATNATLNGTVNPNGDITMAYFQYGLTASYGSLGGATILPATNITLTVPGLVVNSLRDAAGGNWTPTSAPGTNWQSIASSADGSRLAAVVYGGGIYISTNSGAAWTPTSAPGNNWQSVVSSANGTQLAAVVNGGGIYTSTNGGSTWIQTSAPVKSWKSIASSADGVRLMAVLAGATFYASTNSGLTWTPVIVTDFGLPWSCVASSADGLRLAAATDNGIVYKSTDGGFTWTRPITPGYKWSSIASSADGARLALVAVNLGPIITSANGGDTWNLASAPFNAWLSIASSADGTRLAAVVNGGDIYTSTDSGGTWTPSSAPNASWYSIASSADGTRLASVVNGGGIYTSTGPTNSLAPGTTYHYRLVGYNSVGASFGSDLTFTIPGAPTAATLPATGITSTSATLNGTVNPNGVVTSAYFRYGLTTNYGSYSPTNALAATNVTLSVSNLIGSLTPGTIYHFQMVAGNSLGTNAESDLTLATLSQPAVTTLPATGVTSTNATLNGTVNPNGAATSAYFRYGLTTNYGSYSATNTLAATNVTLSVSNAVGGLAPGTTYHFQLVAGNSVGTNVGGDLTFTTATNPPPQLAVRPSSLSFGSAMVGQTNTQSFQVVNTGGLTLTATVAAATPFAIASGSPLSLAPGQTGAVAVTFAPGSATSFSNVVVFTSNGGNSTNTVTGLGLTPYPYGQAVLADQPLGYWRLNETNGTVAHDYFGTKNGTYTNALLGQPGNNLVDTHTAAQFGSVSNVNSFVGSVPIDFATAGNAAFSVECWANGGAQTDDSGIITKGTGAGGEQFNLDCGSGSHAFRFFVRDASGGAHLANGNVTPNNTWHHLVGVCDQANGKVILYVDGVSNASGTITSDSGLLSSANATTFGSRQSDTGAYDVQFVGSLEEVAIYGNALSAAQVLAHYRAANLPPTATNLSAPETYAEDTPLNLTDIVVSDVNSAEVTATLSLSTVSAGSLSTGTSGAVTSTYNAGAGVWSASGAIANVNTLLAGVTFNPTTNFNANFTIATSVSDGVAPAVTGSKAMTGTAVNDAPTVANSIPDQGATQGVPFSFTFATNTYADVDTGNVFTYTVTNVPAWLTFTPATRTFSGTPGDTNVGFVDITVTARDNGTPTNATVSDIFRLTVTNVNDVPVFTKGANRTNAFGTTGAQSVPSWATGISDGDLTVTQALTFNVSVTSGGSIFTTPPAIASNGTLTYTPNGTSGIATMNVSLTDDATAGGPALTSAVQTFTITVDAGAPSPPVINAGSLKVLSNGAFQFTFSNANNFAFDVLAATNVSQPASNWTVLGVATNIGGGLYQFADPQATNFPNRFYRLRFP